MIQAIALALIGQPAAVSLHLPAMPVSRLVAEVGKATDRTLSCTADVGKDVVLIDADNVDPEALMSRLADATASTWKASGGRLILQRASEKTRAEEAARIERDVEEIKQAQQRWSDELAKDPAQDEKRVAEIARRLNDLIEDAKESRLDSRGFTELNRLMPARRAARRLLTKIDPAWLASLPLDQRVVLSTDPNRMQRAMPFDARAVVKEYAAEMSAIRAAAAFPQGSITHPRGVTRLVVLDALWTRDPIDASRTKILLSAQRVAPDRPGVTASYILRLFAIDGDGKDIGSSYETILVRSAQGAQGTQRLEAPLSVASRQIIAASKQRIHLTGETLERALRPESNEPLALFPSELLKAAIAKAGKPTIALLPDSAWSAWRDLAQSPLIGDPIERLCNAALLLREERDGWLVLMPRDPGASRLKRIDRASLGAVMRSAPAGSPRRLSTRAAFYLANQGLTTGDAFPSEYSALVSGSAGTGFGLPGASWLRLYGSLTSFRSNQLPLAQLASDQRRYLDRALNDDNYISLSVPGKAFASTEGQTSSEVTEHLPDGIPLDSYMEATVERQLWIDVIAPSGTTRAPAVNISLFTRNNPATYQSDPENFALATLIHDRSFTSLIPIEETTVRWKVCFTPAISISPFFQDSGPTSGPVKRYEDLPEAFRRTG